MIGVIVAMQSEFDLMLQSLVKPEIKQIKHLIFASGEINGHSVVLMKSGMGKVNAALATVEMINEFHPDYIINTGLAGGIDKNLSVMDIVIGSNIVYHDVWCGEGNQIGQVQELPAFFHSDENLIQKACSLQSDLKLVNGLIATGDQFISDIAELQNIKSKFPACLAVDMESAAIAQTCYLYNIPFLSMRIISDTPGISNHYQQYQNFWSCAPQKSVELLMRLIAKI